jgi:hypothetical protein
MQVYFDPSLEMSEGRAASSFRAAMCRWSSFSCWGVFGPKPKASDLLKKGVV